MNEIPSEETRLKALAAISEGWLTYENGELWGENGELILEEDAPQYLASVGVHLS